MSTDAKAVDNSQPYDSDQDFEKPKDDFTFYLNAFKIEEKKMIAHQKFEDITTKYWQLLKDATETEFLRPTITKAQYKELLQRIYKVLLPLYREKEMNAEIEEEWVLDSRGQSEMTFTMLTKTLFRIAHEWCTNIDIDEYIDLLNRVYDRIIYYVMVYTNGNDYEPDQYGGPGTSTYYPVIKITFPEGEAKAKKNGGKADSKRRNDDWLECRSNESNSSDYEYKYEEDPENMVVKKYKKARPEGGQLGGAGISNANTMIKDALIYNEECTFGLKRHVYDGAILTKLQPMSFIVPFGYPTMLYLQKLKNHVHDCIETDKQNKKSQFKDMSREQREASLMQHGFQDVGLLGEEGRVFDDWVEGYQAVMSDSVYNNLRKMLRDGTQGALRLYSVYPKPGQKSRSRSSVVGNEPIVEINKFGYNPALERRFHYKQFQNEWVNVNYMIDLPELQKYYRQDINKIETKDKLCLKTQEDIKKDEEFNHVETTFKRLRQIMLFKKFESIYNDRASADNKEQKRLKKLIEKEEKRKAAAMKPGNIIQKGLSETYEEKSFIKMMKGPFYQLDSREGLKDDNFTNCAEQDLIDAARTSAMRILVIGKPRCGKTTFAKNLALKLDLVHINVENWINDLLAKIKAYEPPEDLEEGQEPPKWLTDLEENVSQSLLQGGGPSDEQVIEILRQQINAPKAVLKGYVLDLSYYHRDQSWASTIRQRNLLGEPDQFGRSVEFSHIVELWCEDDEIRMRAEGLRVNPEDGIVYSKWERDERKKPKIVNEDEEPPEEEEEIKPLDEDALVQRSCDTEQRIKEELQYYNTVERPSMEELLINLYDNQYIKLDCAGLTPDEVVECAQCRIKPDDDLPLRPLAIQIEGGSDYKSLLTEGLEENQIPRKWSLWKQTDPVALLEGKVLQGLPENAAHYHGNVFVFATEDNLKAFLTEPKKYLQDRPVMPSIFRVLMLGPKGVGKHTQAQFLSDTYGWRIVDYKELVKNRLEELMRFEVHVPNNPQGGRIGLSEQELNDVVDGKPMPAWKYIPWILDFLGYPLEKRKPPPPEEKQENEEEEPPQLTEAELKKKALEEKKKRDEEERKRKEEEELQRYKEDRRRRRQEAIEQGLNPVEIGIEDSEEEPIIIEDLSIDQLVLKSDELTGKQPFVGGFILLNFPETEEQINRLKAHGIEFDRIIYLNDTNEEEPGAEIKKRMEGVELYDWDWELENSQKILNLAKEHLNEETVKEISCNGKQEDVFIRIRNEIDPFYVKIDNPDNVRVSADLGEEDKKLPKGDFGDYCPITYVKDNWLVRGNPEQEVTVNGKTYWLAGEKEAEEFKFNPKDFLVTQYGSAQFPVQPPPPRIMIMGHRGAGVTTQIRMICDKFKLEDIVMKEAFLAKLKEEKDKRKRRRLLDRGFRPPQPPEEEGMEPPPDPEIEEDPDDFEREAHEREVMKMIYNNQKGYVIDGSWRDLPEGAVSQTLQDLLFESRRVPEIVVILKCKEKATFDRLIDRESIRAEYNRLMDAREAQKKRIREEERRAYEEEITAAIRAENDNEDVEEKKPEEIIHREIEEKLQAWDEERMQQEKDADENDAEMPNYDAMEEVEREKLKEQRAADDALFEEFAQVLRERQVVVIDDIKSDMSAEFVNIKILDRIKDNFQFRKDLIERQLAQTLTPQEVKFYEASYIYKHSKFGINSPVQLHNPIKTKSQAVLYRERLYFLTNQDQSQQFQKEPSKFALGVETIPLDIQVKPRIFIIGLPKSGKTTLCKKLVEKIGLVHLRVSDIIDMFIEKESVQLQNLKKQMKRDGKAIDDEQLISLIQMRIQFKDCQTKGWILEDFPKTRAQAMYLSKRGLVPTNVIVMRISSDKVYQRSYADRQTLFGSNVIIFNKRVEYFEQNSPQVISFYMKLYNNVIDIDAKKSKWYIEDRAFGEIAKSLEARQQFTKDYYLRESNPRACKMRALGIDRCLLKQSLSEFKYYCPVTWKNEKLLVKSVANKDDCVLYKHAFYFFKGTNERDLFIKNPSRFIVNVGLPKSTDLPLRIMHHKAAEAILHEKVLNAHCSVTLMDEERVKKGDPILLILFKDGKYVFDTEHKLQRFLANPFKYAKAVLPVKMPPPDDKISLFNLQKMEDSIAFMEQSLGQVVTRGLREISENRLKHPGMSVKETTLKLFVLFLKTENPGNTEYMKKKYAQKMKAFVQKCELPEELYDLAMEKEKKKSKDEWPEFKENYYNNRGQLYDEIVAQAEIDKADNFATYIR